jgi:hypothetical protein
MSTQRLRIERLTPSQIGERLRSAQGLVGAWRDAAHDDMVVWLCDVPSGGPSMEAGALGADVETIDLTPCDTRELLRGPRDRGIHELRHYRLAPGATAKMLTFFADVRRVMPEHDVRVLAWWTARHQGSERFLWLREFKDAAHKARVMKDLYESERWLRDFKPRTVGVIEERILRDLVPLPAAALDGHQPLP